MASSTPTALYLAALQPRAGKSLVALGILEFDFNARLATHLGATVVGPVDGVGPDPVEMRA